MDRQTDTVDVATAAARLGLSTDGVYKRIKRGRLRVQRVDGRTLVILDSPSTRVDATNTTDAPTDGRTDGLDGHVHSRQDTAAQDHQQDATDSPGAGNVALLVAHLQTENVWLRTQVDLHQQAEAELRRLLAAALQQRALPAATPAQADPPDVLPTDSSRPWWRRWLVWP